MRKSGIIAAAMLSAIALTVPAKAADLITVPVSSGTEAVPVADSGFDWNGFYAGLYGTGQTSPLGGDQFGLGADFGVNAQFDYVLVGGELAFTGLGGGAGDTSYIQVVGRAGVVLTDDVLLYAAGGLGADLGPPDETDALLGAGVELAVSDDVTVRAQYLHGFPASGGNPKDQLTLGANVHF